MKNLKLYYLVILFPIPFLYFLIILKASTFFLISMLAYFIYRNIIDGVRLYNLGKIKKGDIWKTNLLMYQITYFKSLYLKSH